MSAPTSLGCAGRCTLPSTSLGSSPSSPLGHHGRVGLRRGNDVGHEAPRSCRPVEAANTGASRLAPGPDRAGRRAGRARLWQESALCRHSRGSAGRLSAWCGLGWPAASGQAAPAGERSRPCSSLPQAVSRTSLSVSDRVARKAYSRLVQYGGLPGFHMSSDVASSPRSGTAVGSPSIPGASPSRTGAQESPQPSRTRPQVTQKPALPCTDPTSAGRRAGSLDFPPRAGHRGYAARADGSGWS
jgi:hypothetical protein